MRLVRTGLQVGLIVGAVVLSAPTALAAPGESDVRITPLNASPGTTVTVTTTACGKETYGKGESEAGGKFHLLPGDRSGVLVGEFVVPEGAVSGTDTVTLKCPPRIKQTATYRISGRPHGGVEAGFGWAAGAAGPAGKAVAGSTGKAVAAPAAEAAGDSAKVPLALGGVLLAGAVAGGAVHLHRRARGARPSA
ncbi:sortase [Streptomyces sp. NK15101]|uniref:sortase n=1 Tax=Streptomyces sp. NK15101 TaxID=2873261 RepID=UPI001CED77B9|nr:sortase [Streptomyces sp. NK15101]